MTLCRICLCVCIIDFFSIPITIKYNTGRVYANASLYVSKLSRKRILMFVGTENKQKPRSYGITTGIYVYTYTYALLKNPYGFIYISAEIYVHFKQLFNWMGVGFDGD